MKLNRMLLCSVLAASGGLFATLNSASAAPAPMGTTRVAFGLNRPIFATHAPGDTDRLFFVEQRGVIRILDLNTNTVLGAAFLNIDALVPNISGNDERGLLGLAFHPDYANNGYFFVNYINNSSDTIIARYTVAGDPATSNLADAGSAQQVMFIDQIFTNHNGGWIGFGPNDGHLYIATGDGGSACDPGQRAQTIVNQKLGKMLRINVDGLPYTIPVSNPFVGITGDDEIWAYGLRNPWRCSFDRLTGDLWIGDVGQNAREEIDFQPAASTGGENYGWDCREGTACANTVSSQCIGTTNGCNCATVNAVDPIHEYTHALGFSLTGGYVNRGCDINDLDGHYFFADFGTARVWSFTYNGSVNNFTERTVELAPGAGQSITDIASFGEDGRGELYIVDRGGATTGEIYKIVPDSPLAPSDITGDGSIKFDDAFYLAQALLGNALPSRCTGVRADVNRDGTINGLDIQEWLLGI